MKTEPDIKALVTLLPTSKGGRHTPAYSGYRPHHKIKEDLLTSGIHTYLNQDFILPGFSLPTLIAFIAPEHYPHCLWVGKIIAVQEGSRIIGYAKVEEIYNDILLESTT